MLLCSSLAKPPDKRENKLFVLVLRCEMLAEMFLISLDMKGKEQTESREVPRR